MRDGTCYFFKNKLTIISLIILLTFIVLTLSFAQSPTTQEKSDTQEVAVAPSAVSGLAGAAAKEEGNAEVYIYSRKGRRDPFAPLITKETVEAEEKAKIKAEEEKLREEEAKKKAAEAQGIISFLPQLVDSKDSKEIIIPEILFPEINISGVMWDPFDPLITLVNSNKIYHTGDFIKDKDGKIKIVEILPDYIIVEKTQNGRTKQKQIGIIRYEEESESEN